MNKHTETLNTFVCLYLPTAWTPFLFDSFFFLAHLFLLSFNNFNWKLYDLYSVDFHLFWVHPKIAFINQCTHNFITLWNQFLCVSLCDYFRSFFAFVIDFNMCVFFFKSKTKTKQRRTKKMLTKICFEICARYNFFL